MTEFHERILAKQEQIPGEFIQVSHQVNLSKIFFILRFRIMCSIMLHSCFAIISTIAKQRYLTSICIMRN